MELIARPGTLRSPRIWLQEFLSDRPTSNIAVNTSSPLFPKPRHAFGIGVGLAPVTVYEVSNRGEFWTDEVGKIAAVIVTDPHPSHPDLNPSRYAPEGVNGDRSVVHLRRNSGQFTVFRTGFDGQSLEVWSCNRDPRVQQGAPLPGKTADQKRFFQGGDDRGHLEERSAGGGPWGINLDSQADYSNQGKTPRWLKEHEKGAAEWVEGAGGVDFFKGVVRTTNMREFELFVAALVELFPDLVTIETQTEAFTSSLEYSKVWKPPDIPLQGH